MSGEHACNVYSFSNIPYAYEIQGMEFSLGNLPWVADYKSGDFMDSQEIFSYAGKVLLLMPLKSIS